MYGNMFFRLDLVSVNSPGNMWREYKNNLNIDLIGYEMIDDTLQKYVNDPPLNKGQ